MAIIKIRWVFIDILQEIALDAYGPYAMNDHNGANQLIVHCQNLIYDKITAIILYYKKFSKSKEDEGYEFNPYDPCVSNKIIKCSQMNVCVHVDYWKFSQKIPKVVGKTITWIKQEYEIIFEYGSGNITVHQGKVHNYLGMPLDYTESGTVKVRMINCTYETIASFDKVDPRGRGIKVRAST